MIKDNVNIKTESWKFRKVIVYGPLVILFYKCCFGKKGSKIAFPLSLLFVNKYFTNHPLKNYKLSEGQIFRVSSQQTFQRCFNVVRLIWRRDVAQRQINLETTLCTSTLEFTTLNSVESMLYIAMLIWTTLDNVETTLSFSTSIYTTLSHVETTLWIWPLEKWKNKLWVKNIIILLSFHENQLNWIRWI